MFLTQNVWNIQSIPLSLEFYGGASYTVSDLKDLKKKLKITSPTTILRTKMSYFLDFRPKIVTILSLYCYLRDFMVKLATLNLTVKVLQKIWKIMSPTTIFRPRMAYFWVFCLKMGINRLYLGTTTKIQVDQASDGLE